jgi:hypothetical protein
MSRTLVLVLVAGVALAAACKKHDGAAPAAAPAGQPAAGAAAQSADTIADLPDYPGATRTANSARSETEHGTAAKKAEAQWTTTEAFATVAEYYKKAVADRGWTVVSTESKSDEVEWRLSKGTSTAKVEVKQKTGSPVTIEIERIDR